MQHCWKTSALRTTFKHSTLCGLYVPAGPLVNDYRES